MKRFVCLMIVMFVLITVLPASQVLSSNITSHVQESDIVFGDINNDGVIDSNDCVLMKRYLMNIIDFDELPKHMDLNGDGSIDSIDYVLLKRYILKIIDVFPVEEGKWVPYKLSENQVSISINANVVVFTLKLPNSGFRVHYNDRVTSVPVESMSAAPWSRKYFSHVGDPVTVEAWTGASMDVVTTKEIRYTLSNNYSPADEFYLVVNINNPEYTFKKIFK